MDPRRRRRVSGESAHRVEAFVEQAGILVLATHSTEICRRWCNKAVWMERGEEKMAADIRAVLDSYNSVAVALAAPTVRLGSASGPPRQHAAGRRSQPSQFPRKAHKA